MKKTSPRSPVEMALARYETLLRTARSGPQARLPSERELAQLWGLSQAAVNRAALQLVAAGRLRREGYKLLPVAAEGSSLLGARIALITQRALCFPGIASEAAHRGAQLEEWHHMGRDTLRHHLREAATRRMDGVIMRLSDGGWEWDAELAELDRLRIPCVVCEEAPTGLAFVTLWCPVASVCKALQKSPAICGSSRNSLPTLWRVLLIWRTWMYRRAKEVNGSRFNGLLPMPLSNTLTKHRY